MNRRIAKKRIMAGSRDARAWRRWRRDLDDSVRRLGRWSPVPREHRKRRRDAFTPGAWRLWWLSFVDPSRPKGDMFVGACQVWADCFVHAVKTAHMLGCNPGSEVKGVAAQPEVARLIPEKYIGVLMSRHECEIFDALMGERIKDSTLVEIGVTNEPIRTRQQPKETA